MKAESTVSWLEEHWALAAGVMTIVGYGAGRWYLNGQYDKLGTTPEEVGLGQADILVRLFPMLVIVLAVGGGILLWRVSRSPSDPLRDALIGGLAVLGVPLLGLWALQVLSVSPPTQLRMGEEPTLMIDVECVEANWLGSIPKTDPVANGRALWLLGSHDGVGIFARYPTEQVETLRLPLRELVLTSAEPAECGAD